MDAGVWDDRFGGYRYLALERHNYEYLYSNVTAIHALVRAWRLTGDARYLDRAERVAEGLETIRSDEYGGYLASDERFRRAPHAGEAYIALSAQNYVIFADLLLYEATGAEVYLDRALTLFDFIFETLWVDSKKLCYHDIQHGRLADWYCTGCNWQVLYNSLLLDVVRARFTGRVTTKKKPPGSRRGAFCSKAC